MVLLSIFILPSTRTVGYTICELKQPTFKHDHWYRNNMTFGHGKAKTCLVFEQQALAPLSILVSAQTSVALKRYSSGSQQK